MFFIEWWLVQRFLFAALAIALALFLFWKAEKRSRPTKWVARLLCTPVVILGILFLILEWSALGCLSYSAPVFSPDRRMAARIRTDDEGALGGSSSVELFSMHGLEREDLFVGGWKSVRPDGIRWADKSGLTIVYEGELDLCAGTRAVRVVCTAHK